MWDRVLGGMLIIEQAFESYVRSGRPVRSLATTQQALAASGFSIAELVLMVVKVLVVAVVAIMISAELTPASSFGKNSIKSVPIELPSNALTDVGVSALLVNQRRLRSNRNAGVNHRRLKEPT